MGRELLSFITDEREARPVLERILDRTEAGRVLLLQRPDNGPDLVVVDLPPLSLVILLECLDAGVVDPPHHFVTLQQFLHQICRAQVWKLVLVSGIVSLQNNFI